MTSFLALFVITPLCFPRRLGALAWVSMFAVAGFLYTAVIIVVRGWQIAIDRCRISQILVVTQSCTLPGLHASLLSRLPSICAAGLASSGIQLAIAAMADAWASHAA